MNIYTVNAGYFKLDGGAMHGVVPKVMWQKVNPADDDNLCTWAMRCLLIEHGDRKILVDNGMGTKQDEKFFSHFHPHGEDTIERSIAKHGYKPEDITDVFLTHLHFDHCGGSVKREGDKLIPAFPNATYYTNKAHWDWAITPNAREKASFLKENIVPLEEAGVLKYIDTTDGAEWIEGIRIRYCNGHTEQMMLLEMDYKGRTLLFCADLLPSVAHISLPWVMGYDMRPLDTLAEKEKMLTLAVENDWVLVFEHDPKNECATVHRDEKGRIRLKETFDLSSL
ncbi:MAG: MBL fold metallo-hydrolase [Flavipsychrobacter sp.]